MVVNIPSALRPPCFETAQDLQTWLLHPLVPLVGRMDLQYASDGRDNSKDNCQYENDDGDHQCGPFKPVAPVIPPLSEKVRG